MTNRHHPSSRAPDHRWLIRTVASTLAVAVLASCARYGDRIAPLPLPSARGDHVDVQGALITANPYIDPQQAESAFGFDIRGAGVLPVRFALDNQSGSVVKINPQQTFLIDLDGQAWPLLTSEQTYNRVSRAVELGEIGRGAGQSAVLMSAAGAVTGFALSVILSRGIATPVAQGAAAGASVGLFAGGAEALYGLGTKIRQELAAKSLRNQSVQPGELAYGVLFFPGRDEARSARSLRLSISLDSYPQVVELPMKQPRPIVPLR